MHIEITEEDFRSLAAYASISIAFEVREVVRPESLITGRGTSLETRVLAMPYEKDYDAYVGNRPVDWPTRFNVECWAILAAYDQGRRVGGAVVIVREVELLEGREDFALLWDLRIAPDARRRGVATALLDAVEHWARARRASVLRVETQDVNVAACRFYATNGFALETVTPAAYGAAPSEIQLVWAKPLVE